MLTSTWRAAQNFGFIAVQWQPVGLHPAGDIADTIGDLRWEVIDCGMTAGTTDLRLRSTMTHLCHHLPNNFCRTSERRAKSFTSPDISVSSRRFWWTWHTAIELRLDCHCRRQPTLNHVFSRRRALKLRSASADAIFFLGGDIWYDIPRTLNIGGIYPPPSPRRWRLC